MRRTMVSTSFAVVVVALASPAIGNLTIDGLEDGFALVVDHTGRATSICELMS